MPGYKKYKDIYNITLYGRNEVNRDENGNSLSSSIRKEQLITATTTYITNLYSQYNNSHIYRFSLNQTFKSLARGSKVMLLYARIPGITNSTIHRTIRLVGAEGTNCFDSERGFSSNPILCVYSEGGTTDQNFYNNDPNLSGLEVPPNFLSKGYIEIELCTVASADITFTQAEVDDLCLQFIIYEPELEETNDINLAPEVNLKSLKQENRPPKFNH